MSTTIRYSLAILTVVNGLGAPLKAPLLKIAATLSKELNKPPGSPRHQELEI